MLFLSFKANARVKLVKVGARTASLQNYCLLCCACHCVLLSSLCCSVVIMLYCYCVALLFVLSYVLIVCTVPLPPGVNPIAVDKYIKSFPTTASKLYNPSLPVPVTAWSKAGVCGRSIAGVAGLNPAGGNGCLS